MQRFGWFGSGISHLRSMVWRRRMFTLTHTNMASQVSIRQSLFLFGKYAARIFNRLPTIPTCYSRNCKWWPTRCNNIGLFYLFLVNSTCFGRCFRPSSGARDCIYSIWYSPPILLSAGVMDELGLQFQLIHDTSRQQYRWTVPDAVNTVTCSWWWANTSLETCRAD